MAIPWISGMRQVDWYWRKATQRYRALPDFIVIGAQKAGTSSLFYYLTQHPQLIPSKKKEIHFFDGGKDPRFDVYDEGLPFYRAHFPLSFQLTNRQKVFEATPIYLFHPMAPQRLHKFLPHVKLIVLLRNPTDRAISHYFHSRRKGHETLPIGDAMQAEDGRLKRPFDQANVLDPSFRFHSYKARGLYEQQLKRYLRYFPMQQLLILNSEDLFTEPHKVLHKVFEFVGVNATFAINDLRPRNAHKKPEPVPLAVRVYLNSFFQPYHRPLYELVEQDFGWGRR